MKRVSQIGGRCQAPTQSSVIAVEFAGPEVGLGRPGDSHLEGRKEALHYGLGASSGWGAHPCPGEIHTGRSFLVGA